MPAPVKCEGCVTNAVQPAGGLPGANVVAGMLARHVAISSAAKDHGARVTRAAASTARSPRRMSGNGRIVIVLSQKTQGHYCSRLAMYRPRAADARAAGCRCGGE